MTSGLIRLLWQCLPSSHSLLFGPLDGRAALGALAPLVARGLRLGGLAGHHLPV